MKATSTHQIDQMTQLLNESISDCVSEVLASPEIRQTVDQMGVLTLECGPRGHAIAMETLAELQWRLTYAAYMRGLRDGASHAHRIVPALLA